MAGDTCQHHRPVRDRETTTPTCTADLRAAAEFPAVALPEHAVHQVRRQLPVEASHGSSTHSTVATHGRWGPVNIQPQLLVSA